MNEPKKTTVTLTIGIRELRQLFMGGNHSSGGGTVEDIDPLGMAMDIIEHGAEALYVIHDALNGCVDRDDEIAVHAWRVSEQLTSGLALVEALACAKREKAFEVAQ